MHVVHKTKGPGSCAHIRNDKKLATVLGARILGSRPGVLVAMEQSERSETSPRRFGWSDTVAVRVLSRRSLRICPPCRWSRQTTPEGVPVRPRIRCNGRASAPDVGSSGALRRSLGLKKMQRNANPSWRRMVHLTIWTPPIRDPGGNLVSATLRRGGEVPLAMATRRQAGEQ